MWELRIFDPTISQQVVVYPAVHDADAMNLVVVTIEEHALAGGFGSAVLEAMAAEGGLGCRIERLGVPDRFIEHGPREALLDDLGLSARGIAGRVGNLLRGTRGGEGT